jgi:molybdopterin converting factor small subunit
MKVNVLFFGATADAVGRRRMEYEADEGEAAAAVFERLLAEFTQLQGHHLLFTVNQEYAREEQSIRAGDELAVFTSVSGG